MSASRFLAIWGFFACWAAVGCTVEGDAIFDAGEVAVCSSDPDCSEPCSICYFGSCVPDDDRIAAGAAECSGWAGSAETGEPEGMEGSENGQASSGSPDAVANNDSGETAQTPIDTPSETGNGGSEPAQDSGYASERVHDLHVSTRFSNSNPSSRNGTVTISVGDHVLSGNAEYGSFYTAFSSDIDQEAPITIEFRDTGEPRCALRVTLESLQSLYDPTTERHSYRLTPEAVTLNIQRRTGAKDGLQALALEEYIHATCDDPGKYLPTTHPDLAALMEDPYALLYEAERYGNQSALPPLGRLTAFTSTRFHAGSYRTHDNPPSTFDIGSNGVFSEFDGQWPWHDESTRYTGDFQRTVRLPYHEIRFAYRADPQALAQLDTVGITADSDEQIFVDVRDPNQNEYLSILASEGDETLIAFRTTPYIDLDSLLSQRFDIVVEHKSLYPQVYRFAVVTEWDPETCVAFEADELKGDWTFPVYATPSSGSEAQFFDANVTFFDDGTASYLDDGTQQALTWDIEDNGDLAISELPGTDTVRYRSCSEKDGVIEVSVRHNTPAVKFGYAAKLP